jgi:hypothetical protein
MTRVIDDRAIFCVRRMIRCIENGTEMVQRDEEDFSEKAILAVLRDQAPLA